jgi:hypothetical protein
VKRLLLLFALIALAFTLAGVFTHSWWLVLGNGFVAALLIFTAARMRA